MDGILAISDIHAEYATMKRAVEYAERNYLYIVFLGDFVDGGSMPFETIEEVYSLLETNKAASVIGNHDYKWYRAIRGSNVRMTDYMINTYWDVPVGQEDMFLEMYKAIYEHENTYYYLNYADWYFAHAAVTDRVYDGEKMKKDELDRLMYGFTNGKRDHKGFPVRLYDWIDEIPQGNKIVVGHDRAPMGKTFDGKPEIISGSNGGMAFFTDTGCGKRPDGTLTGLSLQFYDDELIFDKFVTF